MGNVIKFESLEIDVLIGIANESAEQVEASARKAVEHAERCGRALIAIKAKLPHGEWSTWLGQNFDYSQQHASRYMTIASNYSRVSNLKEATSLREALRMIADDPDTPKRQSKPSVEVIEVAADVPVADVPVAAEIVTADKPVVATVKPEAAKPASPPKPTDRDKLTRLIARTFRGDDDDAHNAVLPGVKLALAYTERNRPFIRKLIVMAFDNLTADEFAKVARAAGMPIAETKPLKRKKPATSGNQ